MVKINVGIIRASRGFFCPFLQDFNLGHAVTAVVIASAIDHGDPTSMTVAELVKNFTLDAKAFSEDMLPVFPQDLAKVFLFPVGGLSG